MRVYQWTLSPVLTFVFGSHAGCRYTPTCSDYALDAIRSHGAFAGSWLTLKRIGRCNPWGGCGHDPVPEKRTADSGNAETTSSPGSLLNTRLSTLNIPPAQHGS